MKKNQLIVFVCLLLAAMKITAQEWTLKLRSSVELRTFRLTNKADISEEKLAGATIALFKGAKLINQVQSDGGGDFVIDVPANGEFILTVSYSGCNSKKFAISTMNVPEEIAKDNYKPTFGIEGVIMAKAFPTINYSTLDKPLVRIAYTSNGKKFDDEQAYTNQMLDALSRIREDENRLIESFTSTNNTGDVALSKGDCPLAKASYEKAMTIIPGETYPGAQLPKVGDCLKNKDSAAKKAEEEAAAKAAAAKLAAEKAEADRLAKEKAAADKAEADRLAKEKAEADKTQSAKLAAEKAEADRLAKEKAATEKAEADRLAKEKSNSEASAKAAAAATEKNQKEKQAKEKAEADRLAKEKAIADKTAADKAAKEKAEADRLAKEKTTTPAKEPTSGITPSSTGSEPVSAGVGSGDAKYSIPQALGSDKYKATIKRADELFKMKRYAEAKPVYEEALKQKPNDAAATNKLAEIERLTKK